MDGGRSRSGSDRERLTAQSIQADVLIQPFEQWSARDSKFPPSRLLSLKENCRQKLEDV